MRLIATCQWVLVLGFVVLGSLDSEAAPPAASLGAERAVDPAAFISKIMTKSMKNLTDQKIDDAERERRFRKIVHETFTARLAGKFVLGRYWPQATQAERAEFVRLFQERMVMHNVKQFKRFKAEDVLFKIVTTQPIGKNDSLVRTKVGGKNSAKLVAMDWRVVRVNGRFRVFDVLVEGMSMGLAHRSEYRSFIKRNGGTVGSLLEALRK